MNIIMRRLYRDFAAGFTVEYAEEPLRTGNFILFWSLRNNWYY